MTPHVMECQHKPRRYEDDRYCNARKKCGHLCDNWAGAGTDHKGVGQCRMHFGNAPNNRNSAKVMEARVKRLLKDVPVLPIDDPISALQELAADTKRLYLYISTQVEEMEQWTDEEGSLRAEFQVLERATDRLERFLTNWVRLGLEERLVRLSERQAEAIGRVIDGVLNALGLDEETLSRARAELPRQLRLVSRAS